MLLVCFEGGAAAWLCGLGARLESGGRGLSGFAFR